MISDNYAPWAESPGCINARVQSFRVISAAHAQIAFGKSALFTRVNFSEITIPHFLPAGADDVIE